MVFLSDHGHVVATEKVRNMRALATLIHIPREEPESRPSLIYDAQGLGNWPAEAMAPKRQGSRRSEQPLINPEPKSQGRGVPNTPTTSIQNDKLKKYFFTKVAKGSSASGCRGVAILNSGHGQELLGDWGRDDAGTTRGRDQTHPDGATLAWKILNVKSLNLLLGLNNFLSPKLWSRVLRNHLIDW